MLAVNSNYYYNIDNQPSIAKELLNSLRQDYNNFKSNKTLNTTQENIKIDFIDIIKTIHMVNAQVETTRCFIDNYYINDIVFDEKILNQFSDILDKMALILESILDDLEDTKEDPIIQTTINSFDELYSSVVNTNFIISSKISKAYLDSKSNFSILQEA